MSVSEESKEQEYDKLTLNVNAVKRYKLNKLIDKKNITLDFYVELKLPNGDLLARNKVISSMVIPIYIFLVLGQLYIL